MNSIPDLSVFYEITKKERNQKIALGCLLTFAGAMLISDPFASFQLADDKLTENFFFLFGSVLFFAGVYIVYSGVKMWEPNNTILFEIINERTTDVVWVYHYMVESMPFGVKTRTMCAIYINLIDGTREIIRVKKSRVKYTLQQMRKLFPYATFGHNVEKEQLYRANPALLKRH